MGTRTIYEHVLILGTLDVNDVREGYFLVLSNTRLSDITGFLYLVVVLKGNELHTIRYLFVTFITIL